MDTWPKNSIAAYGDVPSICPPQTRELVRAVLSNPLHTMTKSVKLSKKARSQLATASKKNLPTIEELRNCIPKHCFERSPVTGSYYILRDGIVILAFGLLAWQLPYENVPLWAYIAWGTALTGWWVIAHECGHGAFSPSQKLNDVVGYAIPKVFRRVPLELH
eukprot:1367560-Amorphochlora_amoeboformis.AAC.3